MRLSFFPMRKHLQGLILPLAILLIVEEKDLLSAWLIFLDIKKGRFKGAGTDWYGWNERIVRIRVKNTKISLICNTFD